MIQYILQEKTKNVSSEEAMVLEPDYKGHTAIESILHSCITDLKRANACNTESLLG